MYKVAVFSSLAMMFRRFLTNLQIYRFYIVFQTTAAETSVKKPFYR